MTTCCLQILGIVLGAWLLAAALVPGLTFTAMPTGNA